MALELPQSWPKFWTCGNPSIPWHTQRDNIAEIVQVLALLTGSLAKFAKDISLLMQSEVAEVSEDAGADRGGSSTDAAQT